MFGMSTCEGKKFWNTMNLFKKSKPNYSWVKTCMDRGTDWGSTCNYRILFMDSIVMLKRTSLSVLTMALWSGS